MKAIMRSLGVFIIVMSLCSTQLMAGALEIATTNKDVAGVLSDVPCVTLNDSAPLKVSMETKDAGLFSVHDQQGISYMSTDIAQAVDGYLRQKDVCVVKEIKITGIKRISKDAIRFRIKSAPGDIMHRMRVRQDIEEIYNMGYFESCNAYEEGGVLTFDVKEYPVIISIEIQGNKKIDEKKIKEAVGIRKFEILNTKTLKSAINRIKASYREKGFYDATAESSTKDVDGGVELTFTIKENEKLFVREIKFDGIDRKHKWYKPLSDPYADIKRSMKIRARRHWSLWDIIRGNGAYSDTDIDTDLLRIEQYFGDIGYINAKVGRPKVEVREGDGIYITIPIEQGQLFHIGKLDVQGDLIESKEEILDTFKMEPDDVMSKLKLHSGMESVRDIYMDKGYANAQIQPSITEDGDKVNITLNIQKNNPVHIGQILIKGNTKTRDKVIRREFKLSEGDLFSSTSLKRSKDRLNRLGYFSKVDTEIVPSAGDTTDIQVNVEENPTGAVTFGMAYSSEDKLMGTIEVSENNLLGKGLRTKLSTEYGRRKKSYVFDFEEPWLLDYPISAGFRIFNTEKQYQYYTRSSHGGNIRMSYPLFEEVRHGIIYTYEKVQGLEDIDSTYQYLLSDLELDGGLTSSITNTIARDTTNDYYRPTRGNDAAFSVQYAGLGGDYYFTRVSARSAQFFPLYKDILALMFKARWATINGSKGHQVPTSELYTLGGLNSIRGFGSGDIGPRDTYGNVIGGKRMVVFNTELTFPIGGVSGLSGVFFVDAGNSYTKDIDLTNIKKSYGGGIRWVTPMGPLRLEYGRVIHPEDYEGKARWDFTIGTFF